MSRLSEFRLLENRLKKELEDLERMKEDEGLKAEMEFEEKLRELMKEYAMSANQTRAILFPNEGVQSSTDTKTSRKPRAVKVYKNPHSGEVIETKGGNHKQLKQWKDQYGADTVDSWLQQ